MGYLLTTLDAQIHQYQNPYHHYNQQNEHRYKAKLVSSQLLHLEPSIVHYQQNTITVLLIYKVYAIITDMPESSSDPHMPEQFPLANPEGQVVDPVAILAAEPGEHDGFVVPTPTEDAPKDEREPESAIVERIQEISFGKLARNMLAVPTHVDPDDAEVITRVYGASPDRIAYFALQARQKEKAAEEAEERAEQAEDRVRELTQESLIDKKTGAFTIEAGRSLLTKYGAEALERDAPLVVLFGDLNSLKYVNEHTAGGYKTGDEYLKEGFQGLKTYFGNDASIIRFNGEAADEFLIIGIMGEQRRPGESDAGHVSKVLAEQTIPAVQNAVQATVQHNPILREQISAEELARNGKNPLGISLGGFFVMPETVEILHGGMRDGTLNLSQVLTRFTTIASKLMKSDKHGNGGLQSGEFEPIDMFSFGSKFSS